MEPLSTPPYSLFADWLSKFHTWPEAIQALWLVAGPATVLGLTWLLLRGVAEILGARTRGERRGRLVYGVYETREGRLLLYRDGAVTAADLPPPETALLPERRAPTSPRRGEVDMRQHGG